jgi:hypothetical protein
VAGANETYEILKNKQNTNDMIMAIEQDLDKTHFKCFWVCQKAHPDMEEVQAFTKSFMSTIQTKNDPSFYALFNQLLK